MLKLSQPHLDPVPPRREADGRCRKRPEGAEYWYEWYLGQRGQQDETDTYSHHLRYLILLAAAALLGESACATLAKQVHQPCPFHLRL